MGYQRSQGFIIKERLIMELDSLLENSNLFEQLRINSEHLSNLIDKIPKKYLIKIRLRKLYPEISTVISILIDISIKALKQLDISDQYINDPKKIELENLKESSLKSDELTYQLTESENIARIEKHEQTKLFLNEVTKQNRVTKEFILKNNQISRERLNQNIYIIYPQILGILSQMLLINSTSTKTLQSELHKIRKDLLN